MPLPILDPEPPGRHHVWQYPKIQMMKGISEVAPFSPAWRNPKGTLLSRGDQDKGGTCTGFGTKFCAEILYMMLTGDIPTAEDIAQFKKDVIDVIGTRYDTGFPRIEISAEWFYQLGRYIGKVTYPAGGDIRFTLSAWLKCGWLLEKYYHTDKERLCVWTYPPGIDSVRETANGGITQEQATAFAAMHKIDGYAMCGTPDGGATWEEVCSAIYNKGFVLAALPIYESYSQMQGGDGFFPDPRGNIAGYHALCFYGYDENNLYLVHSWGDWCGQFGAISRNYFNIAIDQSVWMLVLDKEETRIGQDVHSALTITCNVPATITVNGTNIGISPQKISREKGKAYQIIVSAEGYITQYRMVDSSITEINFILEVLPKPQKTIIQKIWKIIMDLINKCLTR